jgi:hypothetical protein
MDSFEGLKPFVQLITSFGGFGVSVVFGWAVYTKRLRLGREVEERDALISELKADRDRWMQTAMRSITNNERLQNTNEKAVGAVASFVQPRDAEQHP